MNSRHDHSNERVAPSAVLDRRRAKKQAPVLSLMDEIDKQLIVQLQQEGRLGYATLAASLGISERTVRKRILSLLEQGRIRIAAIPDFAALAYRFTAIVGLQVRLSHLRPVAQQLGTYPEVCYLVNVTGRYDFVLIIVSKSKKEFATFMEEVVSTIPGILRHETFVSIKTYKGQATGFDTLQLMQSLDLNWVNANVGFPT